jgi:hypothetical protein
MDRTVNDTERFVYQVCRKSFLSLWSYANPQGRTPGKELCDILVVCEPDIIIFSVKDVRLGHSGDSSIDWARWRKRAIEASCKQIYGAERWIKSSPHVIRSDGTLGLPFPKDPEQRIHRIAIALGSKGELPISSGDFGKGFVHVFDETSFSIILKELDTVDDFVTYLTDKENLCSSGIEIMLQGGEEDLLALYLHSGRTFPTNCDLVMVDDTLWRSLANKGEYKAKKRADNESYAWDRLIERFCYNVLHGNLEFGNSLTDSEASLRTMARENRFSRRGLGKSFLEFIELSGQKKVRSRMTRSLSGVVYVFLAVPHGQDRHARVAELGIRCFVARGINRDSKRAIGIATEQYEAGKGFSLDLCHLYKENWTAEDEAHMESIQKELGYFSKPVRNSVHEDEYPVS